MPLPANIEALHEQANQWDQRALAAALEASSLRCAGKHSGHTEARALRRFQLAECLRRLATRLTVEHVTEGDG